MPTVTVLDDFVGKDDFSNNNEDEACAVIDDQPETAVAAMEDE